LTANPFDLTRQWPDRSGDPNAHPVRPWYSRHPKQVPGGGAFGYGLFDSGHTTIDKDVWHRVDGRIVAMAYHMEKGAWPDRDRPLGWCFKDGDKWMAPGGTPAPVVEDAMALFDREHPLPCPPPMVGQVWSTTWYGEQLVVRASKAGALMHTEQTIGYSDALGNDVCTGVRVDFLNSEQWPPSGAVLIRGPGAPWADTTSPLPWEPAEDHE